ncbi:MAG TPA: hypothetical protein VJO34_13625, partial [Methylomirabilota bacterium]|nr:hypothetical protein [Methylomirabilota bacterium]
SVIGNPNAIFLDGFDDVSDVHSPFSWWRYPMGIALNDIDRILPDKARGRRDPEAYTVVR